MQKKSAALRRDNPTKNFIMYISMPLTIVNYALQEITFSCSDPNAPAPPGGANSGEDSSSDTDSSWSD